MKARTVLQRPAREPGKSNLQKGIRRPLKGHGYPRAFRKPFGSPIATVVVQRVMPPLVKTRGRTLSDDCVGFDVVVCIAITKHHSSEGNSGFSRLQEENRGRKQKLPNDRTEPPVQTGGPWVAPADQPPVGAGGSVRSRLTYSSINPPAAPLKLFASTPTACARVVWRLWIG